MGGRVAWIAGGGLLLAALLAAACRSAAGERPGQGIDPARDRAVAAARDLYRELKAAGVDFTDGPCLAEEVVPGWAVDIAHDPRQPVDDLPGNQCASYRDGRVRHFVELDPEGNLIRAR